MTHRSRSRAFALALALALTSAACASSAPPPRRVTASERGPIPGCARFDDPLRAAARAHALDPGLIAGIVTVESRWHARARSSAGARGLMQIMPSTGRRLGCGDLFEPEANLRCGARLLRRLLDRYDDHVDYALAAYALGAGKVDRAYARGADPPRQSFIRRVQAARRAWLSRGCSS